MEHIKVDAITKCAFAKCMTKKLGNQKTMYKGWLTSRWGQGNGEVHNGKVPVPVKDANAT
ncbi:hypothetical protein FRC06_005542, partial [Ceratobasidium sp. 370]